MKIDRKSSTDINITNNQTAELYFDINDNTLAVKTIDGQFNVKEDNYESEIYKELKRNIKNNSLSHVYKSSIGFCSNDLNKTEFLLQGANAYLISDGTIYDDKLKTESFTHNYTQGKQFWIIAFFEEYIQTDISDFEHLLNGDGGYKIHGLIYNNINVSDSMYLMYVELDDLYSIIFESINNSCMTLDSPEFNSGTLETILYKADHTSIINTRCDFAVANKIIFKNVGKNITNFSQMFYYATRLLQINGLNTSNGTNFCGMFDGCGNLTTIPLLDTSKGTDFSGIFYNCGITSIPLLNTSNGINFSNMFGECPNLTTIPLLDTSKGTNFHGMFISCSNLTTIPLLDVSNGIDVNQMFACCFELTNLGGFKGLKVDLDLLDCEKLTHKSLMNVINNLTEVDTNPTLTLGSVNLAKLTDDEKAIAINKGWILE